MQTLLDAHCHLGYAPDPVHAARQLSALHVHALSMTVRPRDYMMDSLRFASIEGIYAGLGLHPWQVTGDDELMLTEFEALASDARIIGEVGLDFSPKWVAAKGAQLEVFRAVCATCAHPLPSGEKRILSIHAVHAADEVLAVLSAHALTNRCVCVLHSFGGNHQELLRAIDAGCWFSVGPRMLNTKRGRAYVNAIPKERLLIETDQPNLPSDSFDASAHRAQLERCAQACGYDCAPLGFECF